MGKSSKIKQREAEAREAEFQTIFAERSRAAAHKPPAAPLLEEFEPYKDRFIRDPEGFVLRTRSGHRDKQVLEMARYLFGRFRVPRVLEQAWGAYLETSGQDRARPLPRVRRPNNQPQNRAPEILDANLRQIDFRSWFVCVATGGSLYKEHTKGLLTKRETHFFLEAPAFLDLCQAVIYAVARGAGALGGDAQRLARSRLAKMRFSPFWFDTVRFFCLPNNLPKNVEAIDDLVDYLIHRRQEDVSFRLLGSAQSLPALQRRMHEWHRALARVKDLSGMVWDGVDLPDYTITRPDPNHKNQEVKWHFHQIVSGKELAAEGTAMRHCVLSYKARCAQGHCSIWSLTRTDFMGRKTRHLTIEMDKMGTIVQRRGFANRLPRPEEEHVTRMWANAMGLTC